MVKQISQEKIVGKGCSFGTFGELLQGAYGEEGLDFLVTFPITKYSYATYVPNVNGGEIKVVPHEKKKAQAFVVKLLKYLGISTGGFVNIYSEIPVGKGLASSTADLVSCARAVSDYYGIKLDIREIEEILRQIEPSDGVMYPGITSYFHKKVEKKEFLGCVPGITVVGIDEGGIVDTIKFNKREKHFNQAEKIEYGFLLDELSHAIKSLDYITIGKIATKSAEMNQRLQPKKTLDKLIYINKQIDGMGVIIAHSGTCLGIMLSPFLPDYEEKLHLAKNYLYQLRGELSIYYSWDSESYSVNTIQNYPRNINI
ncbi:kinase [Bacillus pseudomycoides]|nr:kinase [Bacillus pseudomycoides]